MSHTLVLVGGGHTHALLIKKMLNKKERKLRLILISDSKRSPYSGMLSGQIAGIYSKSEITVDVKGLVETYGGSFIEASVESIDFEKQEVLTHGKGNYSYDILSINCGARPEATIPNQVLGPIHPIKPTHSFLKAYDEFLSTLRSGSLARVAVIGGGLAGIECAVSLHRRLNDLGVKAEITLIEKGDLLMPKHRASVQRAIARMFSSFKIAVWTGEEVLDVGPGTLKTKSGKVLNFDFALQCTSAQTEAWVRELKLEHDQNFIRIDSYLRTSQIKVFAVGDVAQNPEAPTARAGVYAVKEAPYLYANIMAFLNGTQMKAYHPQRNYLSLIMDGHGQAIASRGWFYFPRSKLMGWLKDRIDRSFVEKLNSH